MPPRQKKIVKNKRNDSVTSVNSTVGSVNSTLTSLASNDESSCSLWYTEAEEKIQTEINRIKQLKAASLEQLELEYKMILLGLPRSVLAAKASLDDEKLLKALGVLGSGNADSDSEFPSEDSPVVQTVKRRRSRSVKECEVHNGGGLGRTTRIRSSSIDAYQTPKTKVRLSALTSAKKYTVAKPKKTEDSGINMRRIMKPDEEAISTSGSPLYVNATTLPSTPHVNIPLPGGVVMNIEAKRPRGRLQVPELDEDTKKQIKILCKHLQNLAEQ